MIWDSGYMTVMVKQAAIECKRKEEWEKKHVVWSPHRVPCVVQKVDGKSEEGGSQDKQ